MYTQHSKHIDDDERHHLFLFWHHLVRRRSTRSIFRILDLRFRNIIRETGICRFQIDNIIREKPPQVFFIDFSYRLLVVVGRAHPSGEFNM